MRRYFYELTLWDDDGETTTERDWVEAPGRLSAIAALQARADVWAAARAVLDLSIVSAQK